MNGLARFVCRGRSQAVLVIGVSALLYLLLPVLVPLLLLSGAALALVTLRNTVAVSLSVLGLAWLFSALILWISGILPLSYVLLGFWSFIWIAAESLRRTNNLALSLLVTLLLVVVALLGFLAAVPDPVAMWVHIFERIKEIPELAVHFDLTQEQTNMAAQQMTGFAGSSILIIIAACQLLGRWLQGRLINPGGFKREFSELRLGRILSLVAIVSVIVAMVLGTQLSIAVSAIIVTVFMFQGLAVINAFTADEPRMKAWLIVFYVLLFLIRQLVVMVSLLGIFDAWIDIRRRWLVKRSG